MKLRHCKYTSATGGCSSIDHPEMNILQCMWNCGFYSNETQTFLSLLILLCNHNIIPDKISFDYGFKRFKPADRYKDIYPDFHRIDSSVPVTIGKKITLPDENQKQFDLYDWDLYNQIVKRFFSPSDIVSSRKTTLLKKYFNDLDLKNVISVLYRGTDKGTEVRLASPEDYLKVVNELLKVTGAKKVLIQTDDGKVRDFFKSELGEKMISFQETQVSYTNLSVLDTIESKNGDPKDHQLWFDAALRIVSECGYLVNHTGNCALWANLYRGNTKNVFQFDQFGRLTE
jgi:hypothetical protein|tara:strand:- start:4026 stop:4883 length:858 start_codon:yes stop_codon:yes gene_type:complete